MKRLLILLFLVSFAAISNVSATNYKLDNAKVDAMFETVQEANLNVFAQDLMTEAGNSSIATVSEKNGVVAFVLCWAFGGLGVHRFYLGTAPMTGIGYILTCGGCGVVAFVDWIVLLININDVSAYVNNPKFFMW